MRVVVIAKDNTDYSRSVSTFINDFRKAPNKLKFMKWGWIDLLASIPSFDMFRSARIFRLFRLLRVFKSIGSITILINHIMSDKSKGILTISVIAAILVIFFSSTFILYCENLPECNIKTAEDAIWWTMCTITTVGYGDKFPITTEGRMIGVLTMLVGIVVFSTFMAFVSSKFLIQKEE
jgi:voltage-gated potassium channel